jgi:hypothetical protein
MWEEGSASLYKSMLQHFRLRYMILACVHETESQDRPEKYVSTSIFCDSQAALKAIQAAKTTSPLVRVPKGVE